MPSAFTHGLVGASLAQIGVRQVSPLRMSLVLAAIAVVQDLDVVAFALGIPYSHPLGHRGFSHSLLFSLILSLLACLLLFPTLRRFSGRWFGLLALTFIAAASHGLLDTATDAGLGIGLLIPFSQERFFYHLRPIRTASVNPLDFFEQRSLSILWTEIVWVWLPLAVLSILYQLSSLSYRWFRKQRND